MAVGGLDAVILIGHAGIAIMYSSIRGEVFVYLLCLTDVYGSGFQDPLA